MSSEPLKLSVRITEPDLVRVIRTQIESGTSQSELVKKSLLAFVNGDVTPSEDMWDNCMVEATKRLLPFFEDDMRAKLKGKDQKKLLASILASYIAGSLKLGHDFSEKIPD